MDCQPDPDCYKTVYGIYYYHYLAGYVTACQSVVDIKKHGCDIEIPTTSEDIWWYHPDHLGSSTYLTDWFGQPSHYYDYLPFGETAVEQNNSMYNNVYKFNAKQLDDETGYYYYGARYYEPKTSVWLSVDPLAEKYPNFSPYAYTFQNPLNFVDPTGMEGEKWDDIIIRLKTVVGEEYKEYARIPTTNYDVTFDLNLTYPFHGVSLAPFPALAPGRCEEMGKMVDAGVALKGKADAVTFSIGGALAYKGGVGGQITMAAFLDGPDKGKIFDYATLNGHAGVEASVGLEIGLIYSEVPTSDFYRKTLAGWAEGAQEAVSAVGNSNFQGFEINWGIKRNKWGIPNGFNISKDITYTGEAISFNVGPTNIPIVTGSSFIGYTQLLGENSLTKKPK